MKLFTKTAAGIIAFLFVLSISFAYIRSDDSKTMNELNIEVRFGNVKMEKTKLVDEATRKSYDFDRIVADDMVYEATPGTPNIPKKSYIIALPPESTLASIEYKYAGEKTFDGKYTVEPAQEPGNEYLKPKFRPIEDSIYKKRYDRPLPWIDSLVGINIICVTLSPVAYNPDDRTMKRYATVNIKIRLKPSKGINPLFRGEPEDLEDVKGMVINPQVVDMYKQVRPLPPVEKPILPPFKPAKMVIISSKALIGAVGGVKDWADYAVWRTSRGITTYTYSIEDIQSLFAGSDLQMKVRNFVKAAYGMWGIRYVLLGGDTNIIPARKTSVLNQQYGEQFIDTDMYYGCLGGTWDGNGNGKYGEMGSVESVDLTSEVFVGRVSLDSNQQTALTQISSYFEKAKTYEEMPSNPYHKRMLFIGEKLFSKVNGGQLKDHLQASVPIPTTYTIQKLYNNATVPSTSVLSAVNTTTTTPNVINHNAHGNCTQIGGTSKTALGGMANAGKYFVYYSIACMPGAYSPNYAVCSTEQECYGEKLIRMNKAGAVAFIGNSHYGLGSNQYPPSDSYSHAFDIRFFKAWLVHNKNRIGQAHMYAKDLLSSIVVNDSFYRWLSYSLNLLGDPSLLLKK